MSRVGRTIIKIPAGVNVNFANGEVSVSSGNNTLRQEIKSPIDVVIANGEITVTRGNDTALARSLHGLYNRLIQNMVTGVTKGFTKNLILHGVGYKAAMKGNDLVLNIGFSHPNEVKCEDGVRFKILTPAEINELNLGKVAIGVVISIQGIDKEKVGAVASRIRDLRPAEPYHLYGIRYSDEKISRKESKSGAKGAK